MKRLGFLLYTWIGFAAWANAAVPPDELVKETTKKVLSELTENRPALEKDTSLLYEMVDEIVLPHFDFERMSRYVLGKNWESATPEQQTQFVAEFKTLLVRTYATALFEYTGQEIVYKPFRHEEGKKQAVVKTEVKQDDGPSIPIEYALLLNSEQWKVYDIRINGLSLVTNYRAQYGAIIKTRGMEELIASLSEKNQRLTSQ